MCLAELLTITFKILPIRKQDNSRGGHSRGYPIDWLIDIFWVQWVIFNTVVRYWKNKWIAGQTMWICQKNNQQIFFDSWPPLDDFETPLGNKIILFGIRPGIKPRTHAKMFQKSRFITSKFYIKFYMKI